MMDKIFEAFLKRVTRWPLPQTKFALNTAFHTVAIGSFGWFAAALDIPWGLQRTGVGVFVTAVILFLILLWSFWICATKFGPLR